MAVITIIGAGMMGTAIGAPAISNGHKIRLVGTPLDREIIQSVKETGYHPTLRRQLDSSFEPFQIEDVDKALEGCDLVVSGVSSFGVEWFAENILPKLKKDSSVLAITKGLHRDEKDALIPFPEYLSSLRPDVNFMAVGGPCICFELADHQHTFVSFCGKNLEKVRETRNLFATDYYHIAVSDDVVGVECCAAMKNAYALGVSMAVGMADRAEGITDARGIAGAHGTNALEFNPKYNPQAALFGQSVIEMRRLVKMLGGNTDFVSGHPGAGDLYVTIFGGRTRRIGTLLGRGMSYGEAREVLSGVTLESVAIITRVAETLRARGVGAEQFPFLMHMDAVINQGIPVNIPWDKFGD